MTDDVTDFDHNDAAMQDFDALSELDSLFEEDERLKQAENNVFDSKSLRLCKLLSRLGFASAGSVEKRLKHKLRSFGNIDVSAG